MKITNNNFQIETTPTGIAVKTDKFNVAISSHGISLYENGELLIDASSLYGAHKSIDVFKKDFKQSQNGFLITLTKKESK